VNNAKAKKDRVVWCDNGWFPYHYAFCPNQKAWDREMEKLDVQPRPPYPTVDGRCTYLEYNHKTDGRKACAIVTMSDAPRSARSKIALLAHEATHIWQKLCEDIGETEPSDEFEAYSVQAILGSLMQAFEMTRGKLCQETAR